MSPHRSGLLHTSCSVVVLSCPDTNRAHALGDCPFLTQLKSLIFFLPLSFPIHLYSFCFCFRFSSENNITRPDKTNKTKPEMDSAATGKSNITEIEGDLFDAPDGAVLIRKYYFCLGSF